MLDRGLNIYFKVNPPTNPPLTNSLFSKIVKTLESTENLPFTLLKSSYTLIFLNLEGYNLKRRSHNFAK